jgi:Flp pilus assembly secretin CpaC
MSRRAPQQISWWTGLAVVAALLSAPGGAKAAETITVRLDHAQVLKLPPKANTVIIGNPMIADVTVQKNGSMVVTGKSYGVTNLIAQDATGAVIGESLLRVEAPDEDMIIVQRGMERESYSCNPKCQPALNLGDSKTHFEGVGTQAATRNSLATNKN